MVNPKLVIWCGEAANHRALANKIHSKFGLAAIVVDRKMNSRKKKLPLVSRIVDRFMFKAIHDAWNGIQIVYSKKFPDWPKVPLLFTDTINSDQAFDFSNKIQADLIIVSGTAIVKEKMLSVPVSIGIINLHTGLSPYVKGGPNCTNWCIANNDWHLVGSTIMWINAGIDSGNIIVNETVDVKECENIKGAQLKVMDHAHDLYIRAINYLLNSQPPYISVPQSQLGEGKLFLTRQWTSKMKLKLLQNWKKRKKIHLQLPPVVISLNNSN